MYNILIIKTKVTCKRCCVADYNFWGYNDIIEIRLPGVLRQQIAYDEVKLLQWFDEESESLKNTN